jgi:hypothetical protein
LQRNNLVHQYKRMVYWSSSQTTGSSRQLSSKAGSHREPLLQTEVTRFPNGDFAPIQSMLALLKALTAQLGVLV